MDHNTCVLTTHALKGAVVPSASKPHVVVSALENAVFRDDRVGVHWVVVDNASPALHAALSWSFPPLRGVALDTCHLPMKYEAVASYHGSVGSRMGLSASSTCPSLRRSARTWTRLNPFEANGTGSSLVTRCSSTTICVARHCPGAHRCRSHQHEEHRFPVGACRVDPGPGGCREGKSRLQFLMAAATFQRYQCTTPLDGGVQAGGPAGHREMG